MIGLNFGKVSKRRNSTRVPALVELPDAEMASLKDGTSLRNPVFILNHSGIPDWNYCRWDSRYYFITDIVAERNDLFSVKCTLDVLATYKADILATNAFVLYDNSGNSEIVDKRLSVKTSATSQASTGTLDIFEVGYSIILGIVGNNTTGMYALTLQEARELMNEMSTWQNTAMPEPDEPAWDPDPDDLSLILQNIGESIFNFADALRFYFRQLVATGKAPDCIKSAILVPVPPSDFNGTSTRIFLGEYDTGLTGKLLTPTTNAYATCTVSIPWQANEWRRNSPYHNFYLSLPYLGVVSLPASEIMDATSLTVSCFVSPNGGLCYKVFKTGTFDDIAQYTGNCSTSYMIGASNVSALTAATSLVTSVGAAAAGIMNPALGVGIGAASIAGIMGNLQPLPSSVSGGGGVAFTSAGIVSLWSVFHDTTVSPSSVVQSIGLPSMQQKTLSSCSGYVQCSEASVSCAADAEDITAINSFLNGGCFIE